MPHKAHINSATLWFILSILVWGCTSTEPVAPEEKRTRAARIEAREDLIGGPRALGEIGDYLLENNKIRIIVQDVGYSRGFGVYGGGIIDMDLRRPDEAGSQLGGAGQDMYGEMFPAFFLAGLNPSRISVTADGSDGGAARLQVTGYGGDFLTMAKGLNGFLMEAFGETNTQSFSGGALPCTAGILQAGICQSEQFEACESPGGLICTPQCVRTPISNEAGEVINYRWFLPDSTIPCNPGVFDDETCMCVNELDYVELEEMLQADYKERVDAICPEATGPFCDPSCPASGVFVATDGTETPCQPGVFDAKTCTCIPSAAGTGTICASYCPQTENNPMLAFVSDYELEADNQYVRVDLSLRNVSSKAVEFPASFLVNPLLGVPYGETFHVPVGDVFLFSAGNHVFSPGAGFDTRLALQKAYNNAPSLPALPGITADYLASTTSLDVSYGVMPAPSEMNFAWRYRENYEAAGIEVKDYTMVLPFSFSSFTGAFYSSLPDSLKPGEVFSFSKYVMVGDGDVGSIVDIQYQIRQREFGEDLSLGKIQGRVYDEVLKQEVEDSWVVVYKRDESIQASCAEREEDVNDWGRLSDEFEIFSQYRSRVEGFVEGTLEAGCYVGRAMSKDRYLGAPVFFSIAEDEKTYREFPLPGLAHINALITDENGTPLPAKITVLGQYGPEYVGHPSYDFLFDPLAGESWLVTDFIEDSVDDPMTRQYIETTAYTNAEGFVRFPVRPTKEGFSYTLVVSRGTEYDIAKRYNISLDSYESADIKAVIRRVVDTKGYIATDLHLHTANSIDSSSPLENQISALAGEGVELVAATDHNYNSDLNPTISSLGLNNYILTVIGNELSTLEGGHTNGYPLKSYENEVLRGSFPWANIPPGEIFATLRSQGLFGPDEVVIQTNHPRDQVLGYFDQFALSGLTAEPKKLKPSSFGLGLPASPMFVAYDENDEIATDEEGYAISMFSYDFDAMELLNGRLFWELHSARSYDPADCVTGDERLPYLSPTQPCTPGLDLTDIEGIPEPGGILIETTVSENEIGEDVRISSQGDVAFPGVVEDWFNLLNTGHRVTGVSNSDSHEPLKQEPGFPRTYVYVGTDSLVDVELLDFVHNIKQGRAIATNGPFIELFVNDATIGETTAVQAGAVEYRVRIQAPQWISIDTLVIYANGIEVERFPVSIAEGEVEITVTGSLEVERDTFLVAEVVGNESLFPIVPPLEVPPLLITEALGSFGGLDLFASPFAPFTPERTLHVKPWAITNPVWLDLGGDGFEAPGIVDIDGDGIVNEEDNCVHYSNSSQSDIDLDGQGDPCDLDRDGDTHGNTDDNCPNIPNEDQADSNFNGIGNACEE